MKVKVFKVIKRIAEISNDSVLYEKYVDRYLEEKWTPYTDIKEVKGDFSEWLTETVIEEIYAE